MKSRSLLLALVVAICMVGSAVAGDAPAKEASSSSGVPVRMVVTVEPRHGANVPVINKEDAMVYQGRDRRTVTDWVPLQGDRGGLELFILLDDAANSTLGSQLEDIRQFIDAQPASTRIGVAYMQNGMAQIVQNLTTDHAQASKSLRLPMGVVGVNASPYFSLEDLIKRWPEANERREVLLVSDGIDRFYGSGPDDPYVDSTIEHAQKAGIVVFAIYSPAWAIGATAIGVPTGARFLSQRSPTKRVVRATTSASPAHRSPLLLTWMTWHCG